MNIKLKAKYNTNKTLILLAIVTLLGGVCASLFSYAGVLFFPVICSFFTALLSFDKNGKGILTWGVAIGLVLIDVLIYPACSFACIFAVASAFLIKFLMSRSISKCECALYITLIAMLLIGAEIYLFAALKAQSMSFSAIRQYYSDVIAGFRSSVILYFEEAAQQMAQGGAEISEMLNSQLIGEIYDLCVNLLISVVAVSAFLIAGLSLKLTRAVLLTYAEPNAKLTFWRFRMSNVFAYFYLVLMLLNFFVGTEGVIAISVMNLYIIFMFVFAYIGFSFVCLFLSGKVGRGAAILIAVIAVVLLNTMAVEFLALLGVFVTITASRMNKKLIVISSDSNENTDDKDA